MSAILDKLRNFKPPWFSNPVGYVLHYVIITMVIMPLCLAGFGAMLEAIIYKPAYNPKFHVLWLPLAGLIVSPIILLRIFWRWPEHILKLMMFVYALQTVGYFLSINESVITGHNFYLANAGIRHVLTSDSAGTDLFSSATDSVKVWKWLEHVILTMYSMDEGRSVSARNIHDTRLMMVTSLKLRQHRVKAVCCSPFFRNSFSNAGVCYPKFSRTSESRDSFGTNLTFQYNYTSSLTSTGHQLTGESFFIQGIFGSYPLAGFSTLFPPGVLRTTALTHLRAMQASGWIDHHTQAIVLDLAVTFPDLLRKPVWAAAVFLLERDTIGRFVPAQPTVHFNYFDFTKSDNSFDGGQPLSTCQNEPTPGVIGPDFNIFDAEDILLPDTQSCGGLAKPGQSLIFLYVGVISMVIYILAMTVRGLVNDWKKFVRNAFNWTDLIWALLMSIFLYLNLAAIKNTECTFSSITQPPFYGTEPDSVDYFLSQLPPRSQFLPVASTLTTARRFLAISVFVHLFNSLRFFIRLKSLGIMVRTMWYSAGGLFSFSMSFLVVFFGFVLMFYYIFSLDVNEFRDIPRTILTLWLGMLGEVNISPELYRARDWTISLIILFTFLSAFVLLTLIISIISNAHEKALAEAERGKETAAETDGDNESLQSSESDSQKKSGKLSHLVSEAEVFNMAVTKFRGRLQSRSPRVTPSASSLGSTNDETTTEEKKDPPGAATSAPKLCSQVSRQPGNPFMAFAEVVQETSALGKL